MDERRSALIIANSEYEDADLRQLVAPARDAEALERVLRDPEVGGFEVKTLLNRPAREVNVAIEKFFLSRKREDLLLLYYSGHGLRDDDGQLYLTAVDTQLIERVRPLRATAVGAGFVKDVMQSSSSRRQVLVLDCCYSGAFAKALMSKGGAALTIRDQFEEGRGLVLLTASAAIQPSFEEAAGAPSIFTRHLVQGVETGGADLDGDGLISLDELYEYVHDRVTDENPQQRPMKWAFDVEGEIVIAQVPKAALKPAELPPELQQATENTAFPRLRMDAVSELGRLLRGKHQGRALAAREALLKLKDNDDSIKVRNAAERCLAAYDEEQRLQQEEEQRAREKPERERQERDRAEAAERERQAKEQAEEEEQAEQERLAREKAGQERLKAEVERAAQQKAEQERQERERVEAAERERQAKEKAEEEEQAEQERLAREKAEQEHLKAEAERAAQQKAEQERRERARAETADQERQAKQQAEQERLKAERAAQQKAEQERQKRERAEAAEREREAKEQAEQERLAREKAEQERLKAEAKRVAQEKAERERQEQERAGAEGRAQKRAEREAVWRARVNRAGLRLKVLVSFAGLHLKVVASLATVIIAASGGLWYLRNRPTPRETPLVAPTTKQAKGEAAERGRQAKEQAEQERLAREKAEQERLEAELASQSPGAVLPAVDSKEQIDAAIAEGDSYYARGAYDKAISAYQRALNLDPENPGLRRKINQARKKQISALIRRGDSYYENAEYDKAVWTYKQALALEPTNPELPQKINRALNAKAAEHNLHLPNR